MGPRPDVIATLLPALVGELPSRSHRLAWSPRAHALTTTETLLGEVVGDGRAAEMFAWLRELPFSAYGRQGLFLHDLVGEVLDHDFRRRDPDNYERMHVRTGHCLLERAKSAPEAEAMGVIRALTHLKRYGPMEPYFKKVDREERDEAVRQARRVFPYSTYRRHLSEGHKLLCELLWHRELGGAPGTQHPTVHRAGSPRRSIACVVRSGSTAVVTTGARFPAGGDSESRSGRSPACPAGAATSSHAAPAPPPVLPAEAVRLGHRLCGVSAVVHGLSLLPACPPASCAGRASVPSRFRR